MEAKERRFTSTRRKRKRGICIALFSSFLLLLMLTSFAIAQQCGCDGCHGNPPTVDTRGGPNGLVGIGLGLGLYSGAHDHFTKFKQNLTCENCHYGGMGNSSLVLDQKLQIGFDINGKPNLGAIYDGSTSLIDPAYSYQATNGTNLTQKGSLKCFNVYCHGGGTGGTNNTGGISKSVFLNKFTDPRSVASSISPAWNNLTAIGCNFCHGAGTTTGLPSYDQDQPKSNSHDSHDGVKCNGCHYATTTDGVTITDVTKHHNGVYDVVPGLGMDGKPASFIYTYDIGGGKCTEVSCHGGFAKTWGNQGRSVYLASSFGTACYQLNITAKDIGGVAGSPPYVYEWDFGDNKFESGTSNTLPVTATHTYATAGTYTVAFNFRDGNHHPGEKLTQVVPKSANTTPVADSLKPLSVKGYTATFTDLSYDPDYNTCGHSGCGKIWLNWGDGIVTSESLCLTDKPSNKGYTHTYTVKYSSVIGHCVNDNSGASTCESTIPVTVPSTFTISGTVVHAGGGGYTAGQPYNGALIDVYRKSGAWIKGSFSDSSGNFSIILEETEHYDVIPDKSGSSGFTFSPVSKDVYTNASDVNFVATP